MEYFIKRKKEYKIARFILSIMAWLQLMGGVMLIYLACDYHEKVYIGERKQYNHIYQQYFFVPNYEYIDFNWRYFIIGCVCLVLALIFFIIIKVALKPTIEANAIIQGVQVVFRCKGSLRDLLVNGRILEVRKTNRTETPMNDVMNVSFQRYRYAECYLEDNRRFRFIWVNADNHMIYIDNALVVKNGFVVTNRVNKYIL